MAENKLSLGRISFPSNIDKDLKIALEDFVFRVDDNLGYLLKPQVVTIAGAYTATDLDSVILCDASGGGFTVTLPDAATVKGKVVTIKNIGSSGTVVIDGNGSQTIDGSATVSLSTQYHFRKIASDGSNWHVISNN